MVFTITSYFFCFFAVCYATIHISLLVVFNLAQGGFFALSLLQLYHVHIALDSAIEPPSTAKYSIKLTPMIKLIGIAIHTARHTAQSGKPSSLILASKPSGPSY